jgi:apolipoprotein N-acyltransferase
VIARFRPWRPALSLAAGLALALAFPDYNVPFLGWISVAALMIACLDAGLMESALCGFAYGAAFYTFSVPWIYTVMHQYGPLPVWQAAGVMALLVIQQSLVFVFFSMPLAWIARRSLHRALLAAPFLWVATDLLRSRLGALSFPWDLLGYLALGNLALAQFASLAGVFGLSFIIAAYNAFLVWFVRARFWPTSLGGRASSHIGRTQPSAARASALAANPAGAVWLGATVALLALAAFGGRLVPHGQPTRVAHLVQTDLPTLAEYPANWDAIHSGDMAQLDSISIPAGKEQPAMPGSPGLIVWPEVPAPFSLQQAAFAQRAARIAHDSQSNFLLGVIDWKPAPQVASATSASVAPTPATAATSAEIRQLPYNSAALLDPAGREEFLYDKMHLVPFSEYVPGRDFLWFAKDLTALAGDFQHGTRYAVGELPGGRFSVFICYEAVFPDEVRRFVRAGAGLLINISNDGWLGRSSGPAQSLLMARMRAIENRRWLLRDTNNGFTASIDPYGRIAASLPVDVRGELDAPYGFRSDLTLYTRWGDWFAWLCAAIALCLLLGAVRFLSKSPREASRKYASRKKD